MDERYILSILTNDKIKSEELNSMYGIKPPTMRKFVNNARSNGVPICSDRKGYWLSDDCAEINKTIQNLQNRITHIQKAVDGLKHCLELMEDIKE